MKSDSEIKDIFYRVIKGSALEKSVTANGGGLYKTIRPPDSKTEDIIISVLDGLNGQFQDVIVNVNIYVPDKRFNDYMIEDEKRVRELSSLAIDLLNVNHGINYRFELEKQHLFEVAGNQHCINNKINLTIINF